MNSKAFGKLGEDAACRYLEEQGYEIVARNYTCSYGEVDIICRRDRDMVFVEVKTRGSLAYGTPAASVDGRKLRHLRRVVDFYMKTRGFKHLNPRIDVVSVVIEQVEGVSPCTTEY